MESKVKQNKQKQQKRKMEETECTRRWGDLSSGSSESQETRTGWAQSKGFFEIKKSFSRNDKLSGRIGTIKLRNLPERKTVRQSPEQSGKKGRKLEDQTSLNRSSTKAGRRKPRGRN